MLRVFVLLLIGSLVCSCASVGKRTSSYDKFTETQRDSVVVHNAFGDTMVQLVSVADSRRPAFGFRVQERNADYYPWNRGILLIDGVKHSLIGDSDLDRVSSSQYGVDYHQRSWFVLPNNTLAAIAKAESVEFRMYSSDTRSTPITFGEEGIEQMKLFINEFSN